MPDTTSEEWRATLRQRAETIYANADAELDDQGAYALAEKIRLQEIDSHIKRVDRAIDDRRKEKAFFLIERRSIERRKS